MPSNKKAPKTSGPNQNIGIMYEKKTALETAKSAKKPSPTPKKQPDNVTISSSVMKKPATRLFGHPAALINPKSRVRCAIIR